jgi:Phosphotransferase enzyme family
VELVFGRGAAFSAAQQLRRSPPAATIGIWRVATDSDSAVLKVVGERPDGHPRWPASRDQSHPYYWRREALAYTSGLLDRLGGGLRAPACRAAVERPDGSVALWLEDVPEPSEWTPGMLGGVARRLGSTQADFAADLPSEPWLSRGWLRLYLELHEVTDGGDVLDRLDTLPHTLCHHDLHPGNVLGEDATVVVDWAYCGLAPLGLDAGVLVADAIADSVLAPELADEAAAAVWQGYAAGLADAGWSGDLDAIRWAYLRGTALRMSWLPREGRAFRATRALLDRWRDEARELASAL